MEKEREGGRERKRKRESERERERVRERGRERGRVACTNKQKTWACFISIPAGML